MLYSNEKLPNGIQIHEFCDNRAQLFHLEFLTCFGMDDEIAPHMHETAHTFEHLMAKYTSAKYPRAHNNTLRLEGLGVSKNAFTSSSTTGYYMEGAVDALPDSLALIGNSISQFRIDPECYQSELRAVENELRTIIAREWHQFDQFVNAKMYAGHPRSKTEQARLDNVSSLTHQQMQDIHSKYYQPQSLRFIVHGNQQMLRHEDWLEFKTFLKQLSNSSAMPETAPISCYPRNVPAIYRFPVNKANNHCKFEWCFPLNIMYNHEQDAIADCTSFLLTHGFASRLYHELRTTLGLVYAVHSFSSMHPRNKDLSILSITATCKKNDLTQAIPATARELVKMKDGPTECDMTRWRNHVRTAHKRHSSDTSVHSIIHDARMAARFDIPMLLPEQRTKLYLQVKATQVADFCSRVFAGSPGGILCYAS